MSQNGLKSCSKCWYDMIKGLMWYFMSPYLVPRGLDEDLYNFEVMSWNAQIYFKHHYALKG